MSGVLSSPDVVGSAKVRSQYRAVRRGFDAGAVLDGMYTPHGGL